MELEFEDTIRNKTISSRTTTKRYYWLQLLADENGVSISKVIDKLLQKAHESS